MVDTAGEGLMPTPEVRAWLQRAEDTDRPTGMSVSCPKCWKPVSLNGIADSQSCNCGTVATAKELLTVFGLAEFAREGSPIAAGPIKVQD